MGNNPSTSLQTCLGDICADRTDCVGFPSDPLYQVKWVNPYNLDLPVAPIAVTRPDTAEDVAGFIKCATENNVKVQAKSGGHSYANFGLGGDDGELAIDLVNMRQFSMDKDTWEATIGAGTRLGDVTQKLHDNGKRAMAHGTCPGVGIGGHATIGGLGPPSRMWGTCLDHVLEVEVVTADGKVRRASEAQNSDLFFALKGAAAGFGVITEFRVKTHPEPGSVVQYSFTARFGAHADMADTLARWQDLVAEPDLDRRFASELVVHELGLVITATFYGTEAEFDATGIPDRLRAAGGTEGAVTVDDWLGAVAAQAEEAALWLSEARAPFVARSVALRREDLLPARGIQDLLRYIDDADRGTLLWFLILDLSGGAVADVAANATAYAHRDKVLFAQGYGIGLPVLTDDTRDFVPGIFRTIQAAVPGARGVYPGYVDPTLADAQQGYWGDNLPALEKIKAAWDPSDVFHNPQSVRSGAGK